MSLEEYKRKRKPSTPEPLGDRITRTGPLYFVVQLHRATREHFDVRVELDGALKSWAVPRGPADDVTIKRMAAETEDHPFAYGAFEGAIPTGRYGAGEVLLWDFGTWFCDEHAPLPSNNMAWFDPEFRRAHEEAAMASLAEGKLSAFFRGHRLKGSYTFVKTKLDWLMIKHADPWVGRVGEYEDKDNTSSLSGRDWEDMARGNPPKKPWLYAKEQIGTMGIPDEMIPFGATESFPKNLVPMKADITDRAFSHEDWLFEPKLDGIRIIATCENGKVHLWSRNGNDVSSQFPEITSQLEKQPGFCVFDGEIVAFEEGRPGFTPMMKRFHLKDRKSLEDADRRWPCVFFVFDLLHFEGVNCRAHPLLERKRWLQQALMPMSRIQLVEPFLTDGQTLYQAALAAGLEGILAKKIASKYDTSGKKSPQWLKIKHSDTHDFVVGGLFEGEGRRAGAFGSLYIGAYNEAGELRCVGRVGTGFTDDDIDRADPELRELAQAENPFTGDVPVDGPTVWLKPERVVEVRYAEVMPGGHLRAPVFVRFRPDLDPAEVMLPGLSPVIEVKESTIAVESSAPAFDALSASVLDQLDQKGKDVILQIGSLKLSVTNLEKKLWPGGTKRDLLRYLTKVSTSMLPHLKDRPTTLIRYPDGIGGEKFFQKHIEHRPEWVQTIDFWSDTNRKNQPFLLVPDLATLLWMGQLGTLEFHVPAGRITNLPEASEVPMTFTDSDANLETSIFNYPDFIRFDLDPYVYSGNEKPGEEPELNRDAFEKTKTTAFWLKDLIEPLGMTCFVKTTGKTGLHLFVPIARTIDTQAARQICASFCLMIERQHPRVLTTEWSVSKRTGKIFLDYNMNGTGRTLRSAYSPTPNPAMSVGMPLRWEELEGAYPEDFTLFTAPDILAKRKDAWADIMESKVDLTELVAGLTS